MDKEAILIQRALDGDEDSFAQLIEIYKNYVFAIILNFINDYEEVENVAQEVFLQIYTSLAKFQNDNFKAWLSRITTNKSIDALRKKRNQFKEVSFEDTEPLVDSLNLTHKDTPESFLMDKESSQEVHKVLNTLPQIYIDVITKFYFEGKTYEEIGKEGDIPYKTVESRLYRGRNLFKKKWREKL